MNRLQQMLRTLTMMAGRLRPYRPACRTCHDLELTAVDLALTANACEPGETRRTHRRLSQETELQLAEHQAFAHHTADNTVQACDGSGW